jgi:hypothetical protein
MIDRILGSIIYDFLFKRNVPLLLTTVFGSVAREKRYIVRSGAVLAKAVAGLA